MERKNKKKIKWDSKKIEEQNIFRGTRMKITENKTPKNVKQVQHQVSRN